MVSGNLKWVTGSSGMLISFLYAQLKITTNQLLFGSAAEKPRIKHRSWQQPPSVKYHLIHHPVSATIYAQGVVDAADMMTLSTIATVLQFLWRFCRSSEVGCCCSEMPGTCLPLAWSVNTGGGVIVEPIKDPQSTICWPDQRAGTSVPAQWFRSPL